MNVHQTKKEVGRQYQGMGRPGVRQVPGGSGEHGKMEKTGCKIICGAPTTIAVKEFMMMMMTMMMNSGKEQSEKSHFSNRHQRSQAQVAGCIERTAVVLRQKRKRILFLFFGFNSKLYSHGSQTEGSPDTVQWIITLTGR